MGRQREQIAAVVGWRRALNSPWSDADKIERHVGLSLGLYMSEAGDSAYPSAETLSEDAAWAESTVREALLGLEAKGWIVCVRRGGGRGNSTEWASAIPSSFWQRVEEEAERVGFDLQTRRDTAVLHNLRGAVRRASREPVRAAESSAGLDPTETSYRPETHRATEGFPGAGGDRKPAAAASEKRRASRVNPPGHGGEVDHEGSKEENSNSKTAAAPPVDAAAAALLMEELKQLRVAPPVRMEAMTNVPLAIAWLRVARAEGRTNPAALFATGFRSGELPSERASSRTAAGSFESRRDWLHRALTTGLGESDPPIDPVYAHDFVDTYWGELAELERYELHEWIDAIARGETAAADPGETTAEAGEAAAG